MSMPQIPEEKHRPNLCEVIIDILKSVALEETALSHILNAEGERHQAIVRKYECSYNNISFDELSESMKQTEKMLSTIIMKEWLLLRKLETAYEINENMNCKEKRKGDCRVKCYELDDGKKSGCRKCHESNNDKENDCCMKCYDNGKKDDCRNNYK